MRFTQRVVRDTGECMFYSFDAESLGELAARVNRHRAAGLLSEVEAMDILEWADEMVDAVREIAEVREMLAWRRERNLERLKHGR